MSVLRRSLIENDSGGGKCTVISFDGIKGLSNPPESSPIFEGLMSTHLLRHSFARPARGGCCTPTPRSTGQWPWRASCRPFVFTAGFEQVHPLAALHPTPPLPTVRVPILVAEGSLAVLF